MNPLVKVAREQILRLLDGHRVQVQTPVGLLELEDGGDQRWRPVKRRPIPAHITRHHKQFDLPVPDELWANDIYEVFVHYAGDRMKHLSIKRYDRAPVRNWRHFQQMKNEICGEFCEAVELFPSEARVADNANQYHLTVFPEGMVLPFGFEHGLVTIEDEDVKLYNESGGKGRQEPMQPGLTMGRKMNDVQKATGISPADELRRQGLNRA